MLRGSIVAVITPMHEDDSIDYDGLQRVIEFHIENQTDGIVSVGTSGESATMDIDEQIHVIKRTMEMVDGRIPVIAGTGGNSTSEALELSAALLYSDESHDTGLRVPWGAIAASILLAVLLVAQLAWAERYQLVRLPQLRLALEFFCQPLNCDLPLRHDISRIEVVEREVRDHPHASGALLINAAFVNRAGFSQAYPVFEVSFSDVSGTPVAVRRFPPAEYLIGRQDVSNGMAPGERAQLMLEVVDPGDRAVSFQFDFL